MAPRVVTSGSKENEKRVGRYMQEIRDIAKAGLNRRELFRMGLVMGGAGAAALQGVRGFKPYWAHADSRSGSAVRGTHRSSTPSPSRPSCGRSP